jgi:hypothetical protein
MTEQTTALRNWSTTASDNNSAAPDGMPEGMPPSGVNDWGRKAMGEIRKWYEQAQWIDFGHSPTRASDTTFTLSGDKTAIYVQARAVRIFGATSGYGIISSSSYSAGTGLTTVTVAWRSGTTPTTPTSVWVSAFSPPSDAEGAGYAIDWLDYPATHTAAKATQEYALSINAGSVAIDLDQSNVFYLAGTAAFQLANPTNVKSGHVFNITVKMDATGGYAVTWGNKWLVIGTFDTAANAYNVISCQYNAANDKYLAVISNGYAIP